MKNNFPDAKIAQMHCKNQNKAKTKFDMSKGHTTHINKQTTHASGCERPTLAPHDYRIKVHCATLVNRGWLVPSKWITPVGNCFVTVSPPWLTNTHVRMFTSITRSYLTFPDYL